MKKRKREGPIMKCSVEGEQGAGPIPLVLATEAPAFANRCCCMYLYTSGILEADNARNLSYTIQIFRCSKTPLTTPCMEGA